MTERAFLVAMAALLVSPAAPGRTSGSPAFAQTAISVAPGEAAASGYEAAQSGERGYRFGLSVELVHLTVTVVNRKGRLVTDLKKEDFHVLEDGIPQEVSFFARGTDAPVDILLLIDASGSMDVVEKVANARNAALQLIYTLDPSDRVAVYGFDRDVFKLSSFSEDKQKAMEALRKLEPFGSTSLHDAVAKASAELEHEGFGRRAIVVITDGVDTSSQLSVAEAVEVAKGVDLPVYAVRVLSPVDDPSNDLYLERAGRASPEEDPLRRIAQETGGRFFEASELGALRLASLRIREELKTQYRLGYAPRNAERDGRFRRVQVETKRKGVEIRTRKGYYARRPTRGDVSRRTGQNF